MFRKIVTELLYSPALAGSLSDYLRRLRAEKTKRQIGVIFVLLAVVVQLFATLFPPESANANNPSILIDGGIDSVAAYLEHYDQNTKNSKDLLSSLGITRTDIEHASQKELSLDTPASVWTPENTRQPGSSEYAYQTNTGRPGIAYSSPLTLTTATPQAYVGSSTDGSWFAIMKDSGSLATRQRAPYDCTSLGASGEPIKVGTWQPSSNCSHALTLSVAARAIAPNAPASLSEAHSSDRFRYTVSVTNLTATDMPILPTIGLADILEYTRILDTGGGEYDFDSRILTWPSVSLPAHQTMQRSFTVQVLPVVPSTARGQYVTTSYDCRMDATFGTTLSISVQCPPVKYVENTTGSLPGLSKTANLVFAGSLTLLATYLYLRAKQLLTEVYIIRHLHAGGL